MVDINFDDGMLHFVFGNEDDNYYLDSLLCVDFKRYMYLSLKESGYKYVYFIDGQEEKFCLSIFDKSSFDAFVDCYKQSGRKGFKLFFKKQTEEEYSMEHPFSDISVPVLTLVELMKSNAKVAVVFSIQAMNELRNSTDAINGFEKIAMKYANKHHALIVYASPAAEESKDILMSEDSVFSSELFALHKLYQKRGKIRVYKQLSDKYGEQCVHYLNRLELKELKNLVLYHFMNDISYYGEYLEYASDMAGYIYMLYHSEDFRDKESNEMTNRARRNDKVFKDFFGNGGYIKALDSIKNYREEYGEYKDLLSCWQKQFKTDTQCELMYEKAVGWKNSVREILNNIHSSDSNINKIKDDILEEICRITVVNQPGYDIEKPREEFIEACKGGMMRYKTVPPEVAHKMLNGLKYVVCDFGERDFEKTCGETTERQRGLEIIELHKTVIEIARLCYNIDTRISELKENIADSEKAMKEHRREEEAYERNHYKTVQNTETGLLKDQKDITDAWELANLRKEFINDYKMTMSTRCSQNSLNELKIRLKHLMDSLEVELNHMETIELAQVNTVLSRAMESIKSNKLNREQMVRELTESTQEYEDMQAVMQEMSLEHSTWNIIENEQEFNKIFN